MPLLAQVASSSEEALSGIEAIVESNGLWITVTGLLIVFAALTAISVFIAALPKLLDSLGPYLPEIESHWDPPSSYGPQAGATPKEGVDPQLVAAIGWAVHHSRRSDR